MLTPELGKLGFWQLEEWQDKVLKMVGVDVKEQETSLSYCSPWALLYMDVTHLKTAKQK